MSAIKIVKVSEKGQIAIPIDVRELIGINKGDELLLLEDNGRILIQKTTSIPKKLKDHFKDIVFFSEKSLKEVWDNKKDDVWDSYLKK